MRPARAGRIFYGYYPISTCNGEAYPTERANSEPPRGRGCGSRGSEEPQNIRIKYGKPKSFLLPAFRGGAFGCTRDKAAESMPLLVRFERRVPQSPLLHRPREAFVPAQRTDVKIAIAALVDPSRIMHYPTDIARKPLRRPPSPVIAENLLCLLDKSSAQSVLLHSTPFQFVQI